MSCEHLVMSYSTFSKTKNDALKEPMFFGQPVNVARYDQQKYEVFEKLIEKQLSFFWPAPFLLGMGQAGHGAGHAHGGMGVERLAVDDVALAAP